MAEASATTSDTRIGRPHSDRLPNGANPLPKLTGYLTAGILPVATSVLLVVAWAVVVRVGDVPAYLLPAPQDVLPRIVEDRNLLWANCLTTLTEILIGFLLTVVTAIPLGLLFALSSLTRRALYPVVVVIQLVPKIAVAPLFLVWFGFGLESKVFLVVLLTFFPFLIASMTGFRVLDERYLYLTRSMGASGWQTFRYLRFPEAMPVVFSGAKTSATLATTGAIVAEFVGANRGLGYQLLRATSTMDAELIFAIILVLTIVGVVLNGLVEIAEYVLTPWQRRSRR
jgi:NitT/TauT family transport system permease protein